MKWMLLIVASLLAIAYVYFGMQFSQVEYTKYNVISKVNDFEIRLYPPATVAQVIIDGQRKNAASQGLQILTNYIFSHNYLKQQRPIIVPLFQQLDVNQWKIFFFVPKPYSLSNLPKPIDKQIKIVQLKERIMLVIQFRGAGMKKDIQAHLQKLKKYAQEKKLILIDEPIIVAYNPPWVLPFMRKNEIMVEIKK